MSLPGGLGYVLQAGYHWEAEDRGRSDKTEFRHFAQSTQGGPRYGEGSKPWEILQERRARRFEAKGW